MSPASTRAAASGDPWPEIDRLAAELAAREPHLRPLLEETVLRCATPGRIVGATLARRLAPGNDSSLEDLLTGCFDGDPGLLGLTESDLAAVTARDPACRDGLHALLNLKGFQALQSHRAANSLWRRCRPGVAHWIAGQAAAALGVDIHPAVPFGAGVLIDHGTGIVIGETAVVEDEVSILHGVTLGSTGNERGDRHPKIRRGAILGAGAKVLGNVEVGPMSRVGAGSVVVSAVPPYSTVVGVPARVVRTRLPDAACIRPARPRRVAAQALA